MVAYVVVVGRGMTGKVAQPPGHNPVGAMIPDSVLPVTPVLMYRRFPVN